MRSPAGLSGAAAFWEKLKPRERMFAAAAAGVAVLCLFYRAAFVPTLERLQEVRRAVDVQIKQLAAHRRAIAQQEAVFQAYQRYANRMRTPAGDEEETSTLLSEVSSMAREAGLTVLNLKSRPVETRGLMKWYRVDVESEASSEALTRFIYQVGRSPNLLRVERLEAKQDAKAAGPMKCTFQISKVVIP